MRRRGRKLAINIQLPPDVWAKFKLLVGETGASINYCMERVLIDVLNQGRIPGVAALEAHESRENEKYGQATQTYDGEPQEHETPQPKPASAPPSHAPHARSRAT